LIVVSVVTAIVVVSIHFVVVVVIVTFVVVVAIVIVVVNNVFITHQIFLTLTLTLTHVETQTYWTLAMDAATKATALESARGAWAKRMRRRLNTKIASRTKLGIAMV
jgi:hypothetical protein